MDPATQNFVHLHLHTEYSTLDGATRIPNLIKRVSELEMEAVAVTDHGGMFGIYDLFAKTAKHNEKLDNEIGKLLAEKLSKEDLTPLPTEEAEKARQKKIEAYILSDPELNNAVASLRRKKVKPIAGVEAYFTFTKPSANTPRYHLILLAINKTGYQNLCALISLSNQNENYYYKPCVTYEMLKKYNEGIIVTSACVSGPVARPFFDWNFVRTEKQSKREVRVEGNFDTAIENLLLLKKIFPDRFYLEIMLHPYDGKAGSNNVYQYQIFVTAALLLLAREYKLPLIITNDVHFLNHDDAEYQQVLVAIGTAHTLKDEDLLTYSHQEYLKSYAELLEVFTKAFPDIAAAYRALQEKRKQKEITELFEADYHATLHEAFHNTIRIAEQAEEYTLKADPMMPDFEIPDENFIEPIPKNDNERRARGRKIRETYQYLRHLVFEGAKKRWGDPLDTLYQERLEFELRTIGRMKFPGYFLIVADFIAYARSVGTPVGPGRGSAAGSAVSYCLGITNLDPIRYNLLFERFLNPDRVSLPDIDVDLDDRSREVVIEYLRNKYGAEYVAGIATIGRSKVKNTINDVQRVVVLPEEDIAKIRKALKSDEEEVKQKQDEIKEKEKQWKKEKRKEIKSDTFLYYYTHASELKALREKGSDSIKHFLALCDKVEGSVRNIGQHACGYVISKVPLYSYVPEAKLTKSTEGAIIQYESKVLESIGLVKMDLLGLRTLQIIDRTIKQIEKNHGIKIDIEQIPLDDRKTFELFAKAETREVFQFESPGMRMYLKELAPNNLEDLIAMNALFRPGPIEYIPDYIKRKHATDKIEYDLPVMEDILKTTYGITVYQEQVMQLSRSIAGFSVADSDVLRKAIGKKDEELMNKMQEKFIKGAIKNGHPENIVRKIWEDWDKFASYAFNRSHAACYAYIAYQSGYLKAHYPYEYMTACLQAETGGQKLQAIGAECARMDLTIAQPDINLSKTDFSLEDHKIRFGLSRIKGINTIVVDAIIEEREKNGLYKDMYDFVERIPDECLTEKFLELLAESGTLDSIAPNSERINLLKELRKDNKGNIIRPITEFVEYGKQYRYALKESAWARPQTHDEFYKVTILNEHPTNKERLELLQREREVLGLYLSGHPLDEFKMEVLYSATHSIRQFKQFKQEDLKPLKGKEIKLAGLLTVAEHKKSTNSSKNQSSTAYTINLEDYTEKTDLKVKQNKIKENLHEFTDEQVLVTIDIKHYDNKDFYYSEVTDIQLLSKIHTQGISNFILQVDSDTIPERLTQLRSILNASPGTTQLTIHVKDIETKKIINKTSPNKRITVNMDMLNQLTSIEQPFWINNTNTLFQPNLFSAVSNMEIEEETNNLDDIAPLD